MSLEMLHVTSMNMILKTGVPQMNHFISKKEIKSFQLLPQRRSKRSGCDAFRGRQAVGKIRKPVKVWLVLLWLTMVLNLLTCSDTVSPACRSNTAEPEVTRKPWDVSHCANWTSLPFISLRHTWLQGDTDPHFKLWGCELLMWGSGIIRDKHVACI